MKKLMAWVSLALTLGACGDDDGDAAGPCMAGTEATCACNDGSMSTQTCNADGAFEPCACSGPTAQGGGSGADPGASGSGGSSGAASAGEGGMGTGAAGEGGNGEAGTQGGSGGVPVDPSDPFEEARQACVDKINMLRSTLGLAPLERWVDGEACADEESRLDSESGIAHDTFGMCDERAQNSCTEVRSLDITRCLDNMFAEGPPPSMPCEGQCFQDHGHYLNITSTRSTQVACGFYDIPGSDRFWALQNFR